MFPVLHQDFHGLQPRIAPHRPALTAWSVRPSRSPPVAVLGAPPGWRAMECGHVEPPRCLIQGPSPAETYKYLFIYLFVYLFICLPIVIYIYMFIFIYLFIYLFIDLFIYVYFHIYVYLFVCVCHILFLCVQVCIHLHSI